MTDNIRIHPVDPNAVVKVLAWCSQRAGRRPHMAPYHISACNAAARILSDWEKIPTLWAAVLDGLINRVSSGEIDVDEDGDHPRLGTQSEIIPGPRMAVDIETRLRWELDHWVAQAGDNTTLVGRGISKDAAIRDLKSKWPIT